MAYTISRRNHRRMDALHKVVLEAYAKGDIELITATGLLGHVMTAAAIDNEGEFLAWLNPEQQQAWLKEARRVKGTPPPRKRARRKRPN